MTQLTRFIIAGLLILTGFSAAPAMAQSPPGPAIKITASGPNSLTLEMTAPDVMAETMLVDGLTIPGMGHTVEPGRPQLPQAGALLAVPTLTGLTVELLAAEPELLTGYRLPPLPRYTLAADTLLTPGAIPALTPQTVDPPPPGWYPHQPVILAQTGFIREQAVARLQFYPLQIRADTGEARFYRRRLVRLSWDISTAAQSTPRPDPYFEPVLAQTLFNYRPPAVREMPPLPPAPLISPANITPTLKIGVTQDGIVALTYDDVTAAGFPLAGVDPHTLKLTHRGIEQPVLIPGEADGRFDPGDTILFYGTAITDIYTSQNVYWLSAGALPGRRMAHQAAPPQAAPTPAHFPATTHAEQNSYYWQTMPNGAGQDHWFWGSRLTAPATRAYTVTLNHLASTTDSAVVSVRLKGRTSLDTLTPDHHTRVHVNGLNPEPQGQWWDGLAEYTHALTVPQTALANGANAISLTSVGDTGAAVDQLYVNWLEIDYRRAYTAAANELLFGPPAAGRYRFEITGFTAPQVELFDITTPGAPVYLKQTAIISADASYTLAFETEAAAHSRYLALTPAQFKQPANLEMDRPSNWRSTANAADYLIITHPAFYTATLPLAQHHRQAGLRVAMAQVDDLYDEFNHGIFNPQAIRDFIAFAYAQWQPPAPAYALLVGDAAQDYRDYQGTGAVNFVPTQLVQTELLGDTPSDNWFVAVSGADNLPDLHLGRLSTQTATQVEAIIAKTIGYAQVSPAPEWRSRALLVEDDDLPDFAAISASVAAALPATMLTRTVAAASYPPGDPTADIVAALNEGTLLVNYAGHGSVDKWGTWAQGRIFENANIAALTNGDRLPLVTAANCLNGFFPGPSGQTALAEALQRHPTGGAAAVWAPTGLNYPSAQRALLAAFYGAMAQNPAAAVGQAATAAKLAVGGQSALHDELVDTYVLFGDPAMQLAWPQASAAPHGPVYLPVIVRHD